MEYVVFQGEPSVLILDRTFKVNRNLGEFVFVLDEMKPCRCVAAEAPDKWKLLTGISNECVFKVKPSERVPGGTFVRWSHE